MDHPLPADRLEELLAHRAWVRRVAVALVRDGNRADDLEQEVWLRALQSPPPRPSRAWLGTVLRNVASNLGRGERRRGIHETSAPPGPLPPSPADLLERAEVVERVAHAVRELEEPYRTAVLLRYFEDLSPPDIATRLAAPLETIRTRLKRGLAMLRDRLDGDHGGDRRAWTLLLLPIIRREEPPGPGPAGPGAGAATGVLVMGINAKLAGAAVVLVLAAGTLLLLPRGGERGPEPGGPAASASGGPGGIGRNPEGGAAPPPPIEAVEAPPGAAPSFDGARLSVRVLTGPGRTPVAEALVTVTPEGGEPVALTTGPDGSASMDGLEDGPCVLLARAPGLVRADGAATLEAGRESVVELVLARGGAVAVTVLDDREGTPLAGARVAVLPGGSLKAGAGSATKLVFGSPYGGAVTDALGRARLDGIETGEIVTVRAEARGHGPGAESLVLEGDAKRDREIVLRLPRAATLRGVATLPDGKPAAGAVVYVLPADAEDMLATPGGTSTRGGRTIQALRGEVGEDGSYEVDGLDLGAAYVAVAVQREFGRSAPARGLSPTEAEPVLRADFGIRASGSFRVRLLRPDGTPGTGARVMVVALGFLRPFPEPEPGLYVIEKPTPGRFPLHVDASGCLAVRTEVEFPAEGDGSMEVRLEPGLAVAGTLVDDAGSPLAGVKMLISRPWQMAGKVPPSEGEGITDAAGRFRVDGLRDGTHQVILVLVPGGGPDDDLRVEVPGEDARIVVKRGGTIRARLGLPAGGAAPETVGVGIVRRTDGGESTSRSSVPWNGGLLALEKMPAGDLGLLLEIAGFAPMRIDAAVAPGAATDLGEIRLDPGVDVEGRVVDGAGAPVPGAVVSAGELWTPTREDVVTGRDGLFTLRHLARGTGAISVAAEGFLAREVPVEVPAAGPVVVTLRRGGTLVVRILDAGGGPVAGANVRLTRAGAEPGEYEAETTDHRGRIELRLEPGRWTARLCDDEWRDSTDPAAAKEADLPEEGAAAIDIVHPGRPVK